MNPLIENGILSGKINPNSSTGGNKIHIYLLPDSVTNLTTEMMVRIPLDDIDKIEISKISTGKSILLAIGCTFALIIIIGLISGSYGFQGFDWD